MTDVFLSYKREQRPKARILAEALVAQGYDVWWDVELLPGAEWAEEIVSIIEKAKAAIVLWSEQAIESTYVRAEAKRALDRDILIPARLDGCRLPLPFGEIQTLDLTSWDGNPESELLDGLWEAVAQQVGKPVAKPQSSEEICAQLELGRTEAEYWRSVSSSNTRREYQVYLEKFGPSSVFAELAHLRIEALDKAGPRRQWSAVQKILAFAASLVAIVAGGFEIYSRLRGPAAEETGNPVITDESLLDHAVRSIGQYAGGSAVMKTQHGVSVGGGQTRSAVWLDCAATYPYEVSFTVRKESVLGATPLIWLDGDGNGSSLRRGLLLDGRSAGHLRVQDNDSTLRSIELSKTQLAEGLAVKATVEADQLALTIGAAEHTLGRPPRTQAVQSAIGLGADKGSATDGKAIFYENISIASECKSLAHPFSPSKELLAPDLMVIDRQAFKQGSGSWTAHRAQDRITRDAQGIQLYGGPGNVAPLVEVAGPISIGDRVDVTASYAADWDTTNLHLILQTRSGIGWWFAFPDEDSSLAVGHTDSFAPKPWILAALRSIDTPAPEDGREYRVSLATQQVDGSLKILVDGHEVLHAEAPPQAIGEDLFLLVGQRYGKSYVHETQVARPDPVPLSSDEVARELFAELGGRWIGIEGSTFEMELGSFALSKSEVTVEQYNACVEAGGCKSAGEGGSCNAGVPGRDRHPVNCVDWHQAKAFARWLGGDLPTEAEWEFAASSRGIRLYPWGDDPTTDCLHAVVGHCSKVTVEVCQRSSGNTVQGLCDMAGNLWEWAADSYGSNEEKRVVRGGGFGSASRPISRSRDPKSPENKLNTVGFRVRLTHPSSEEPE